MRISRDMLSSCGFKHTRQVESVQVETHQVFEGLGDGLSHVDEVAHNEATVRLPEVGLEGAEGHVLEHGLEVRCEAHCVHLHNVGIRPKRRCLDRTQQMLQVTTTPVMETDVAVTHSHTDRQL